MAYFMMYMYVLFKVTDMWVLFKALQQLSYIINDNWMKDAEDLFDLQMNILS